MQHYTVLIAESDAQRLAGVRKALNKGGFRVRAAETGSDALHVLANQVVDVVLCAAQLPDIPGFALRRQVLDHPELPDVIWLTLATKDDVENGVVARIDAGDLIFLPIDAKRLTSRVDEAIAHRESVAELARVDTLTQVMNRHMLELEVSRALERLRLEAGSGCLAWLDVDGMTTINQVYGMASGNRVLAALGRTLKRNCRNNDRVGRYSDDTFVAYFHNASADSARAVLKRIQERFAAAAELPADTQASFTTGLAEALGGGDFHTLCSHAQQANAVARQAGPGATAVWAPALQADTPNSV